MSCLIVASAIFLVGFVLIQLLFKTEQARIKGIPEIPGWPIVGNLLQLGSDHAAVCMKWAEKHGPVFQVRSGSYVISDSLTRPQNGIQESHHCQYIPSRQRTLD